MALLDSILSVVSGGVTGLIGVGVQKYFEFKTKELDMQADLNKYAHEVKMKEAEAAIMAQEWAARTKVAEVEGAAKVEVEDAKAFSVALDSEPKRYSEGFAANVWQAWLMFLLDFLRGTVRPLLTFYLCAITTKVYLDGAMVMAKFGTGMTATQAFDLNGKITDTILYLTTAAVLFWFGTRPNKQK